MGSACFTCACLTCAWLVGAWLGGAWLGGAWLLLARPSFQSCSPTCCVIRHLNTKLCIWDGGVAHQAIVDIVVAEDLPEGGTVKNEPESSYDPTQPSGAKGSWKTVTSSFGSLPLMITLSQVISEIHFSVQRPPERTANHTLDFVLAPALAPTPARYFWCCLIFCLTYNNHSL